MRHRVDWNYHHDTMKPTWAGSAGGRALQAGNANTMKRRRSLNKALLGIFCLLMVSLYTGALVPEVSLSSSRYSSLQRLPPPHVAEAAASPTFRPAQPWLDNNGDLIQAHGGGILYHNGTFYWYGENKAGRTFVPDDHEDEAPGSAVGAGLGNATSKQLQQQQQQVADGAAAMDAQQRLAADVAALDQQHLGRKVQRQWRQQRLSGGAGRGLLKWNPPRVDVIGVSCYSSRDLQHWKNEGLVLRAGEHPDLAPERVVERPKVLYNPRTKKFVMWMHIDDRHYEEAKTGVAVSDSPTGPFRYLSSFRPHNQMARDLTIFQDDDADSTGWLVYASEDNKVLHVSRLTPNYLDVEPDYIRATVGLSREAPAVFKHQGHYLLLTSGCTGWAPNAAEVFAAGRMEGPWVSVGNPCKQHSVANSTLCQTTFDSQGTWVLPVPGQQQWGHFIFMADRWTPDDLGASPYLWLPLWATDLRQYHRGMVWKGWHADGLAVGRPPVDVVVRWEDQWDLRVFSRDPYI